MDRENSLQPDSTKCLLEDSSDYVHVCVCVSWWLKLLMDPFKCTVWLAPSGDKPCTEWIKEGTLSNSAITEERLITYSHAVCVCVYSEEWRVKSDGHAWDALAGRKRHTSVSSDCPILIDWLFIGLCSLRLTWVGGANTDPTTSYSMYTHAWCFSTSSKNP